MSTHTNQRAAAQRGVILPEVCTVDDISFHLDRSRASILRLMRNGEIPARKLGGRWYTTRLDVLGVLEPDPMRVIANRLLRNIEEQKQREDIECDNRGPGKIHAMGLEKRSRNGAKR